MGKARSYEIIEYRKNIMDTICKSPEIVKLLGAESSDYPEEILPYTQIFPYEFIPETITETNKFICFEIQAHMDYFNKVLKDLTVWFFVFCHEKIIRRLENGRQFLWYDQAVCELDNIFTDTNILGIGKMALQSNVPYYPVQRFKGRQLTFKVKDFYNGSKYGK